MKNYLKFVPIIFILFGCSNKGNVASLQQHKAIEVLPAHPNNRDYDYLVTMQNARNFGLDLARAESRSQALNTLMDSICPQYQITHEQTLDMPDLASPARDLKNYYYFLKCDRP